MTDFDPIMINIDLTDRVIHVSTCEMDMRVYWILKEVFIADELAGHRFPVLAVGKNPTVFILLPYGWRWTFGAPDLEPSYLREPISGSETNGVREPNHQIESDWSRAPL